jgi:autoinducer 2-degrading protein
MTITFLSRMKVFPHKEKEFIELCRQLEAKVLSNEPETLLYTFYRLEEPLNYAVLESFSGHAAEEAHLETKYFKAIVPDLVACIDGTYHREYLYPLDGKK